MIKILSFIRLSAYHPTNLIIMKMPRPSQLHHLQNMYS